MAKSLDFLEVVELINHSRITEIDINPVILEKGKWALFKGLNKVPNFTYPFYVLYIYSDFTKESSLAAAKSIIYVNSTQVIFAPSVKETYLNELKNQIKNFKDLAGFRNLKDYFLSFIQDQLKVYLQRIISELEPKYYVDPPYETPSGFKSKIPNPLYSFLIDNIDDIKGGSLGVLLAEPGQGKTYTTRYLATTLATNGYIPIYIHSPQWFNMKEDDLSSLYKTITYSFRYFDAPLDWIEGVEDLFINITLKLGMFRIIFDGFDEYILWNKGKFTPNEIINNLHTLADQSNSRILVTSRTTFWNSSITDDTNYQYLYKYEILPFDQNHAQNYFEKRLVGNPVAIHRAAEIFGRLKNFGRSDFSRIFAGRGIILNLIADLSDSDDDSIYDGNISVFQWILYALCLREEKRQRLPINAEQQLTILRQFAEYKSTGYKPSTELLLEIIPVVCEKLTNEEINSMIGLGNNPTSLQDHPLIFRENDKKNENPNWKFKHEQIEFNLLAEQIIFYSKQNLNTLIKKLFSKLTITGSILDDLCTVIYEQISAKVDADIVLKDTLCLLTKLQECSDFEHSNPRKAETLLAFSTKLLMYVLNKNKPIGRPKNDRMKEFLKYLNKDEIIGLHFTGTLNSLDFSNVVVSNSRFENVVWSNCKFDDNSIFRNCFFIGGNIHNCENFGLSRFIDCQNDAEADSIIAYEILRFGEKKVTTEDIKRDIQLFIKRFMPKEGLFKSVSKDNLMKGTFGLSPYKDELLDVMGKYIIEKHTVSFGTGVAYNIRQDARDSIKNFLSNNIFSGDLAKAYNELCRRLKVS
jgi:hypothetical protein